MTASAASYVLADKVGPGGTAALVVLVLIVASIGIFFAFIGSLKRLRKNVRQGTFNTEGHAGAAEAAADDAVDAGESSPDSRTVTQDPKGRGAGGA